MADTNSKPQVKVFRKNISWKKICLVIAGIALAIAIYFSFQNERISQSSVSSCENLPEQFDRIELPACPGCWRVKLQPNKFSGKVWLPKRRKVNFDLEWDDDSSLTVRNKLGKVFTLSPEVQSNLGIRESNEVLQFKGNGYVRIRILRIWRP